MIITTHIQKYMHYFWIRGLKEEKCKTIYRYALAEDAKAGESKGRNVRVTLFLTI